MSDHGTSGDCVVVDPEGGKAEVKNGVVKVNGTPYFVSDSGAMVIDGNGQLIGHIEDGKFGVVTDEYMQNMQQKGYIQ